MKTEMILEVQAYLDNELPSPAQAGRVANLVAQDSEAARLFKELKETRQILAGNELPAQLPESGEFYWSKIARAIERENELVRVPERIAPWWVRVVAPLAGLACVGFLLVGSGLLPGGRQTRSASLHEIENSIDDSSGISFHSQSQGMTVVWVKGSENP